MCDLNRAPIHELAALGVDTNRALDLQLWRPYRSWQDVEKVPGMDARFVAKLKEAGATLSRVDLPEWTPPEQPYRW